MSRRYKARAYTAVPAAVKAARAARGGAWDQKTDRCHNCVYWTDKKSEFAGWQFCSQRSTWQHASGGCALHQKMLRQQP